MKKFRIMLSLICVLAILFSCGCSDNTAKNAEITPDYEQGTKCPKNDVLTFADDVLTLSLDAKNGNVTIKENASGNVWCSNPQADYEDEFAVGVNKTNLFSQIAVSTVTTSNSLKDTNSYISSIKKGTYEIYSLKNGFRVEYTFNEGFTIPVEYVLNNGSFEASILYSGIKEYGDEQISTIALLPYFGTASLQDSGFLLVPDGSGALINFNNGKKDCAPYESKVYGVDESLPNDIVTSRTEQIYVPLIGMKKNGGAYIARAVNGSAEATVNASVAGINSSFNNIYFKAIYREAQNLSVLNGSLGTAGLVMYASQEPTDASRFTVRYSFVDKSEATFGDMVSLAREQMLNEGALKENGDSASLYVDLYGGVSKQKSFLGIQYTGIEALTTFKQASELLSALKENGADNLTVGFKNYSKSYFSEKLLSDMTPVSALGGKKGIAELKSFAEENDIPLYFEGDFYSFKSGGNGFSKYFDITKALDLGAVQVYPQKVNTNIPDTSASPYYMLKPSSFDEAADSILKTADKAGIEGLYLTDISNSLSADYGLGGIKRSTAADKAAEATQKLSKKKLLLSSPNYYMWKYAESAVNVPISSSQYHLFDCDVPMLQMLFKGNMSYSGYPLNLSSVSDDSYLLHIAYAQNIHYGFMADDAADLQSTDLVGLYGLSNAKISEATEKSKQFSEYYEFIKNLTITDYSLSGEFSKTVYDDGTCVLVNYSKDDMILDGITVKGRGWSVVRDGNTVFAGGEEQ